MCIKDMLHFFLMLTLEENDCKLIEFNGEVDHVHLVISYEPKHSISSIINNLKGKSSRLLKRDFPDTAFNLNQKSSLWTRSYFAGSAGGVTLEILKNKIPLWLFGLVY